MIHLIPDIDKKYILDRVSQEEIFERYMGIRVIPGELIRSPLRDDSHPTCSFKWITADLLWFKDWSGHFAGDCFTYVQRIYNCSFFEACKIIAEDFKLIDKNAFVISRNRKPKETSYKETEKADIKVKWRKLEDFDLKYWNTFGIETETLNRFNVGAVEYVWLNKKLIYMHSKQNPCYGYWFSSNEIKVYFPFRSEWRFLVNSTCLQGYYQLPIYGDLLIVTKSLKDVMYLWQLGIPAVAPQSESSILTEIQYLELSKRFKQIISLYDFDLAGIRGANKMKRLYGVKPKFFTNGRFNTPVCGGKDITDIIKHFSKEVANEQLDNLLTNDTWHIIEKEETEEIPF